MHLPAELILHVATYLDPVDCQALSRVVRVVRKMFLDKMSRKFGIVPKPRTSLGCIVVDFGTKFCTIRIYRYCVHRDYSYVFRSAACEMYFYQIYGRIVQY